MKPKDYLMASSASPADGGPPCRDRRAPLLLCHGLAGDLLLTLPTLRALHHIYGDRLALVTGNEPFPQELLSLLGFRQPIGIDFASALGSTQAPDADSLFAWTFDVEALLPRLPPVDLVINLCFEAGQPFDELVRRLGVPSIGFHATADVAVLHDTLPPGMDAWGRCFAAVTAIDPSLAFNDFAWLPRHPQAQDIRNALAAQLGGAPLLVVHADTKVAKMWPLLAWKQLLAQLLDEDPQLHIVMVGYPSLPFDCYGDHERLIDGRDLTLMASFEMVSMADWFIGIDSCMLHAADLARVPSVGIFTADYEAVKFGFRFSFSQTLQGANPPDDVSVSSVKQAFDRVRRAVADRRSVSSRATS